MPKIRLRLTLEPEIAAFLHAKQTDPSQDALSAFINSLLRHERFRQGLLPTGSSSGPTVRPFYPFR